MFVSIDCKLINSLELTIKNIDENNKETSNTIVVKEGDIKTVSFIEDGDFKTITGKLKDFAFYGGDKKYLTIDSSVQYNCDVKTIFIDNIRSIEDPTAVIPPTT